MLDKWIRIQQLIDESGFITGWHQEQNKFCTSCTSYHDTIEEAKSSCEQDPSCEAVYDLFCDGVGKFGTCEAFTVVDQTHPKGVDCVHRKGK